MTQITYKCDIHGEVLVSKQELRLNGMFIILQCGCSFNFFYGDGSACIRKYPKKCKHCSDLICDEDLFEFEGYYYHDKCFKDGYKKGEIKLNRVSFGGAGHCMD